MNPILEDLVPRKKAAAILGIKPQTLAAWACTNRVNLPFVKVGGRVMYRLRDLAEFIERHRVVPSGLEG